MKSKNSAKDAAQEEMCWGKTLVNAGIVAAAAGIALYCKGALLAGAGQQGSAELLAGWGVAGFGGLLLIVGSIKYLGVVDHDLPDDYF